jgi:hypothetical protein
MTLSDDPTANGASVTLEILSKLSAPSDRSTASVALMFAAIELLLATRWKSVKKPKFYEQPAYALWKFKHVSYVFSPLVDDEVFATYESVRRRGATTFLIVPSNHDMLVRDAFDKRYGKAKFCVSALEDHMSWRIMWASLDEGWSYEKTIEWWLQRYNAFLAKRNSLPSLQIEFPSTSPVA